MFLVIGGVPLHFIFSLHLLRPLLLLVGLKAIWTLAGREWVKSSLQTRGITPLKVRWRPFAWGSGWGPSFRVVYQDSAGITHQARCDVLWWDHVRWRDDQVIDFP